MPISGHPHAARERLLEESDDPDVRAETRAIRLSADRALAQIESMLKQARTGETRGPAATRREGDLAATVRFAAGGVRAARRAPQRAARGGRPGLTCAPLYDPERVSRIVANLIANAVRFSPTAV